jgi:hypothetical protein
VRGYIPTTHEFGTKFGPKFDVTPCIHFLFSEDAE